MIKSWAGSLEDDGMPCLEVSGITADYGGKIALSTVDLEVARGEVVALIGSNGAGKSTLLKAIIGLVAVREGAIRFNGERLRTRPSANARLGIGYLPQGGPAFIELTVRQNLAIAGLHLSEKELATQFEEMLVLFPGLRERLDSRAGVLSGGERQMLGLARAMIAKPTLLLLDEPTTGLHPDLVAAVFSKVRELNVRCGTAMLIVEQNVEAVLRVSSRAYGLKLGQIVLSGNTEVFLNKERLRTLFVS